jgi:DNA-binding NtrC family response regulator
VTGIEADCLELLKAQPWPGNVRQLRNVIERALVVTRGPMISIMDLPEDIKPTSAVTPMREPAVAPQSVPREVPENITPGNGGGPTLDVHVGMSMNAVKRELLLQTLKYTRGNKAKAAEILGVSLKTLYNHLKEDPATSE